MRPSEPFRRNDWPTIGVEVELQLVDTRSMALRSAIADLLGALPQPFHDSVKPEFLQCYVEVNTGVCRTVDDAGRDLKAKLQAVERAADQAGVALLWAATHPFSRWRDQEITPDERYYKLADQLQETVVRPVTFGLHVHVGVESGDMAIRVGERLQEHLPLLLALSANSPFWQGRETGHHSHRVELLEGIPTGGLPPMVHTWEGYVALLNQLKSAGFIESNREIWWDVRPSPDHGTVEIRICDMPPDLPSVLALTALAQCLVVDLVDRIKRAEPEPGCHPLIYRQNRWRACRYGASADLVDPISLEPIAARRLAERTVERLRPVADRLACPEALGHVLELAASPSGAERQLALFEETGDLPEVIRRLLSRSALLDAPSSGFPSSPHLTSPLPTPPSCPFASNPGSPAA